jgi:hypothetical protein
MILLWFRRRRQSIADDRPRFLRNAARKIIFAEAFRMPARISRFDVGTAALHGLRKNLPVLSS